MLLFVRCCRRCRRHRRRRCPVKLLLCCCCRRCLLSLVLVVCLIHVPGNFGQSHAFCWSCVYVPVCVDFMRSGAVRGYVSGTLGNDVVVSEHTTSTALRSSATSPRRETLTAFLFVFVASYWHYNCGLCFAYRLPYKSSETCLFSDGPRPGARCLCREEALCSNPDALQEIKESKLTSESRSAFVILPCTFHYVLHAGSPSKYAVVLGMGWPSK